MLGFVPLGATAADLAVQRDGDLSVTVYRAPRPPAGQIDLNNLGGFALVSETRTMSIPEGESRIRFEGVADGIESASAIITGLPGTVLEKNRDARLLSPSALVAATLGRSVMLVRTNLKTGKQTRLSATVRSDADGGVLFETSEGVEALRCSGLPETFSFMTNTDLAATPTLSALVRSSAPVTATVTLSYLAHGFDWTANYVATLSPDGTSMDLGGWVTLANSNGVTFPSAHTQVVAGRINHDSGELEPLGFGESILAQCWPKGSTSDPVEEPRVLGASPDGEFEEVVVTAARREYAAVVPVAATMSPAQLVQEEQLGDLKLYRVPQRTTLTSRQIKQVRLLDRQAVPVELFYSADLPANYSIESSAAQKTLRTRNDTAHHLGLPLPSGHVATFTSRKDSTLLLDEAPLRDVAVDEDFEFGVGSSPDVQFSAVLEKSTASLHDLVGPTVLRGVVRLTSADVDDVSRVEIHNASRSAIRFELRLRLADGAQLIGAEPIPTTRDGRPLFKLAIPAGGSTVVRYQTEHTVVKATAGQ
jgi:hypothetical protein